MNYRSNLGSYLGDENSQRSKEPFNDSRRDNISYAPNSYQQRTHNYPPAPQDIIEVLMVAEKPSIARTIADSLTGGKYLTRKGESKYCQVYEFNGSIFNKPAKIKITSVTGHIFCRDFPKNYSDWYQTDPIDLFDAETLRREVFMSSNKANPENNLTNHLIKEANGCVFLVLWLDNDKEGENICFEVIDICNESLLKKSFQQIFRAKFSSITRRDIIHAFESLSEAPNKNQMDARQIIDLKVGVAFSRFQSLYLKKKFQNLNQKMITFGPCQTPTLNFCVEKHHEILNFRPTTYYKIDVKIEYKSEEPVQNTWVLNWDKEISYSNEEVLAVKEQVNTTNVITVMEIVNKESIKQRPEGINTVQMLKHCSSKLGLGPNEAMNYAEKLYLGGYITYPRTETSVYSNNFDFLSILHSFAKSMSPYGEYAAKLIEFGYSVPTHGFDAGDHPPITPTPKIPSKSSLPGPEGKMYDFICRQFLATISRDAKFAKTKVFFNAGGQIFNLNGVMILDHGFTEIVPWIKISNKMIPTFTVGEKYRILETEVKDYQTMPPNYLSESELISLMEKHGIGTDASMATHINNICQRNFVEVLTPGRRLRPTPLGNALIVGYKDIDAELVSAELRSNIERNVELIAQGKANFDTVLASVLGIFKKKYEYFRVHIAKIETHFAQVYGTFNDSLKLGTIFSLCGRCSSRMTLVQDFNKLYCKTCKITLNLPRDSKYSIEGQDFCVIDGFQIINYYILREGLETHLRCCPQCYHRSPYPVINGRMICSQCPNEKCKMSSVYTEVCICTRCRKGQLILNRGIMRTFVVTCNYNKCNYSLALVQGATDVLRSQDKCAQCYSYKLKIFISGHLESYEICVFCDERFNQYISEPDVRSKLDSSENNRTSQFKPNYSAPPHVPTSGPAIQRKDQKKKNNHGVKMMKGKRENQGGFHQINPTGENSEGMTVQGKRLNDASSVLRSSNSMITGFKRVGQEERIIREEYQTIEVNKMPKSMQENPGLQSMQMRGDLDGFPKNPARTNFHF